jgi:hypothetical protein
VIVNLNRRASMTDHSDQMIFDLGKRIADYLRVLSQAERPAQDVWWKALGLAVAEAPKNPQ